LDKEESVTRYLCEDDLIQAIHRLVNSLDDLVRMAQSVNQQCADDEEPSKAIRRLLEGLKIPLPPELIEPSDVTNVQQEVKELWRRVDRESKHVSVDPSILQHACLGAWGHAEKILRNTLHFYVQLFSDFSEEVEKAMDKKDSLAGYFRAMRTIDNAFKHKDNDDLREEAQRRIKRDNPFAGFDINKYHQEGEYPPRDEKTIQKYRNSFAHATPYDVAKRGADTVKEALKIVDELFEDLSGDPGIAPRVIYFTAKGWDEYGREVLWFVDEIDAKLSLQSRTGRESRMFRRNSNDIELLRPYLTISQVRPFMFEPPVYPMLNA
jgi:hypothetical protein